MNRFAAGLERISFARTMSLRIVMATFLFGLGPGSVSPAHALFGLFAPAGIGGESGEHDALAGPDAAMSDLILTPVAEGLEYPWSIAFLPDGRLLVTERMGRLRLIDAQGLHPEPIAGTPVVATDEHMGLLDIVLDPAFDSNQRVYFSYGHGYGTAGTIRVMRARFTGHALEDGRVIYETPGPAPEMAQLGGRLAFGGDGMLYLTLGDRWSRDRAQDLTDPRGKILRIDTDGRAPADNPFVTTPGTLPEIWSYGHRNPQGLVFDPETGRLWSHEHGPQGGDELNLVEGGLNYGWPIATFGIDYDDTLIGDGPIVAGTELPVWTWTPSLAPSGLAVYRGDALPGWNGNLVMGSLKGQALVRLQISETGIVTEERYFEEAVGRIRDVRVSPAGEIWLVNDAAEGGLYRVDPMPLSADLDMGATPTE